MELIDLMSSLELEQMTYEQLIKLTLKELDNIEHLKKSRIIMLAAKLEKLGTPKDMISQQISRDLQGRVNSSYVRACLGEDYKDSKQVRKQSTSQSRGSNSANDSKKVLSSVEKGAKEVTKEQEAIKPDLYSSADSNIIESLENKIKDLEQERDYLIEKLGEESPDFPEVYEENRLLRQIEKERTKHDFNSAKSLNDTNSLQQEVNRLRNKLNEQEILLANNTFCEELELKGQMIPLIIVVDRTSKRAKVTLDTSKVETLIS